MTQTYQLKPDPFSSHTHIARLLRDITQKMGNENKCTVLDIGCSEGFIGFLLPEDRFSFIGIDNDHDALEKLPPIYEIKIEADIESPDNKYSITMSPDVIVFADVLEHTRYPEQVLKQTTALLKPGGYVIISLPNIANLVIRLSLLFGEFNYTDRGILDRTHLRFFTIKTAKSLFNQGGFELIDIMVTPVPLPLINPIFSEKRPLYFLHVLNFFLTRIMKGLLAYQIICVGQKKHVKENL